MIELHNRGSVPVPVGDFRTDCSCMQVYQLEEGLKRTVTKIVVPAGGSQSVYIDLRGSGEPGTRLASAVFFRDLEADPGEHRVAVLYTPVARVYAFPRAVAFGIVPAGVPATRRVEVRSDGTYDGNLDGLRSSGPDAFAITIVPTPPEERAKFAQEFRGQHLLGYLDITFRPGPLEGSSEDTIVVTKDGQEFLRLTASAQVVADYAAAPSRLTLPRTEGGNSVYTATVHFRSRDDQKFRAKYAATD